MKESNLITGRISNTLCLLVCFMPLLVIPGIWDPYYLPKAICLYLACGVMIVFLAAEGRGAPCRSAACCRAPLMIAAGYLIWVLLSCVFAADPALAFGGSPWRREGFFTVLSYLFVFCAAMLFYKAQPWHGRLFTAVSTMIAFYGVLQRFGLELLPMDAYRAGLRGVAFSTVGNPNFFGSYLVLSLPVTLFFYLSTGKRIALPCAGMQYFALLASETQGAWIGAFVGVLCLFAFVARSNNKAQIKRLFVLIAILLGLSLVYELLFQTMLAEIGLIFEDFFKLLRFAAGSGSYESAVQGGRHRVFIWQCAILIILKRPLFGAGPECMNLAIAEDLAGEITFRPDLTAILDRAHNEYLHVAVSSGIPAAVLFAALFVLALCRGFRNVKVHSEQAIQALPVACAVLGYAVAAVFNISVVPVAPVFWFFAGVLTGGGHLEMNGALRHRIG